MKNTYLAFSILIFSGLISGSAWAEESCPEGAIIVETIQSDNKTTYFCECMEGYEDGDNNDCVKAQPKLEPVNDVVDPRWLRGGDEAIEAKLDALKTRRAFLEKELAKLKTIEGGMTQLVTENATASREIMQDTQTDALATLSGLLWFAKIPANLKPAIDTAVVEGQALLSYRDYDTGESRTRRDDKLSDHVGVLKNAFIDNTSMLSAAEIGPTRAATEAVVRIHKIYTRHNQPGATNGITRADFEDVHAVVLEAVFAANPWVGAGLKATNSAVVVVQGAYALKMLENDSQELEEAFKNNRTAVRYYESRLEKLAEEEAFYKAQLGQ